MKTMGQNAPYALFEAEVTNLPDKKLKGMICSCQRQRRQEQNHCFC